MKCFAAFSILSAFAVFLGWGAISLHKAGILLYALASAGAAIGMVFAITGIIWALATAIECLS